MPSLCRVRDLQGKHIKTGGANISEKDHNGTGMMGACSSSEEQCAEGKERVRSQCKGLSEKGGRNEIKK